MIGGLAVNGWNDKGDPSIRSDKQSEGKFSKFNLINVLHLLPENGKSDYLYNICGDKYQIINVMYDVLVAEVLLSPGKKMIRFHFYMPIKKKKSTCELEFSIN